MCRNGSTARTYRTLKKEGIIRARAGLRFKYSNRARAALAIFTGKRHRMIFYRNPTVNFLTIGPI